MWYELFSQTHLFQRNIRFYPDLDWVQWISIKISIRSGSSWTLLFSWPRNVPRFLLFRPPGNYTLLSLMKRCVCVYAFWPSGIFLLLNHVQWWHFCHEEEGVTKGRNWHLKFSLNNFHFIWWFLCIILVIVTFRHCNFNFCATNNIKFTWIICHQIKWNQKQSQNKKNKQENIPVGITSNNRTFGCPIICTAFIQNAILFNDTSNDAGYNQFID